MPTRVRYQQWTRQPPPTDYPDAAKAASDSLEIVFFGGRYVRLANSTTFLAGPAAVGSGTPSIQGSPWGLGARFAGGGERYDLTTSASLSATEGFTIEVLCSVTSVASLSGFFCNRGPASVTGTVRGLIGYSGSNNRNIYFWGSAADLDSGVEWRQDGLPQHVFVTSAGGSGTAMTFWRDGRVIAAGTTPTLASTVAAEPWRVGDTTFGWNSSPVGWIHKAAFYRKALSAERIDRITANPWQLFAPRRLLVPVAAGGGIPTLSAATVFAITANSAQPRVTVTF